MKNSIKTNLVFFVLAVITAVFIYSCGEDTPVNNKIGPDANTINGKVTFTGTPFTTGGYYFIAAYSTWLPAGPPTSGDTLVPVLNGTTYEASYKLTGVNDGQYVVTAAWVKLPYAQGSVYGLGIYGCAIPFTPACVLNPPRVTITNNAGVESINFNSVVDTSSTSRAYHF